MIQNSDKVIVKARFVSLEITMGGFPLYVAVPEGNSPEKVAAGIRASMAEIQGRSDMPNIRDIYEMSKEN